MNEPTGPATMRPQETLSLQKGVEVGDTASFAKTITETDVVLFAGITGDFNPAHVDEAASSQSRYGGRIAHGMLSASLICTVLGMYLPGPGSVHCEQRLKFVAPVRPGDTITARAEVVEMLDRGRVRLRTWCTNHVGATVLDGEAIVLLPASLRG